MLKFDTIKKHHEFKQIIKDGKKEVYDKYVVYTLVRDKFITNHKYKENLTLYGILTSKKLGNACVRNFYRRKARCFVRERYSDNQCVYIIIPYKIS